MKKIATILAIAAWLAGATSLFAVEFRSTDPLVNIKLSQCKIASGSAACRGGICTPAYTWDLNCVKILKVKYPGKILP